MPNVVLVNDTSLFNSHFGCQLVGQTIREQLSRFGLNLTTSLPLTFDRQAAQPYFQSADLIIINGEGSIHNGRNVELLNLANQFPTALINCVFQNNGPQPALKSFCYVSARESLSAKDIRKQGSHCHVVPDLIFASMLLGSIPKTRPDIPLGFTDNVTNPLSGFSPKSDLVFESLSNLLRCKTLCAGRFHAAIAASVLQIPFSTWDSNTWKTRGMMEDMGMSHLHFETQAEAIQNVPNHFDPRINNYVADARQKIETMFSTLHGIANRSARSKAA